MAAVLAALFGYVLGTIQVLLLDWFRQRSEHAKHLRTLRAELRRLASFEATFDVSEDGLRIESDHIPNAPRINPKFLELAIDVDFRLTDEHSDDNAQEAILNVAAGCDLLQYYVKAFEEKFREVRSAGSSDSRRELRLELGALAEKYNQNRAVVAFTLQSALEDVERRLNQIRFWSQVARLFRSLPKGHNPLPIGPGDPRLMDVQPMKVTDK